MKKKLSLTLFPLSNLLWIGNDTVEVTDFYLSEEGAFFKPRQDTWQPPESSREWVAEEGGGSWRVLEAEEGQHGSSPG